MTLSGFSDRSCLMSLPNKRPLVLDNVPPPVKFVLTFRAFPVQGVATRTCAAMKAYLDPCCGGPHRSLIFRYNSQELWSHSHHFPE